MENIIKKYKYQDLTGQDIFNVLGKYPVLYSDLVKYNDINDLCPSNSPYQIILYQVSNETSGHYVAIWIKNDIIFFFDSYGYRPDDPIKLGLVHYDEQYPFYLSDLIQKSNMKCWFNNIDYQSKQDVKISTCGRWSTFAIKMRSLFPDNFHKIFRRTNKSQFLNIQDNLITILTLNFFDDLDLYFNQ